MLIGASNLMLRRNWGFRYSGHNVDGCDPDSCTNVVFQNSQVRAGDDCVAIYSVHGPTRNVTVRNVTCHTPLSITHGPGG